MLRFFLGVIAGFAAKKYYDENKMQVDEKLKKLIEPININSNAESFNNNDKADSKNTDNTTQPVEFVR